MKWEYKIIVLDEEAPTSGWSETQAKWRSRQVQILNKLGQDKWEVVNLMWEMGTVLLKRPIE